MKRAPRSRQRHDLYAKYHDYDSEISDLLGECGIAYDRSIDILVSRLRRKMEDDPKTPQLIQTVRSGGYQFIPETVSE